MRLCNTTKLFILCVVLVCRIKTIYGGWSWLNSNRKARSGAESLNDLRKESKELGENIKNIRNSDNTVGTSVSSTRPQVDALRESQPTKSIKPKDEKVLEDIKKRSGLILDISNKGTDFIDYIERNCNLGIKHKTYTAKQKYFINRIVKGGGCFSSEEEIWNRPSNIYPYRVKLYQRGGEMFMTIVMRNTNNFVILHKPKNKDWFDITAKRDILNSITMYDEKDQVISASQYKVGLKGFSCGYKLNEGVKCAKITFQGDCIWECGNSRKELTGVYVSLESNSLNLSFSDNSTITLDLYDIKPINEVDERALTITTNESSHDQQLSLSSLDKSRLVNKINEISNELSKIVEDKKHRNNNTLADTTNTIHGIVYVCNDLQKNDKDTIKTEYNELLSAYEGTLDNLCIRSTGGLLKDLKKALEELKNKCSNSTDPTQSADSTDSVSQGTVSNGLQKIKDKCESLVQHIDDLMSDKKSKGGVNALKVYKELKKDYDTLSQEDKNRVKDEFEKIEKIYSQFKSIVGSKSSNSNGSKPPDNKPIELNIKSTQSTDNFDRVEHNGELIFIAISDYCFNKVKDEDVEIWSSTDTKQCAVNVSRKEVGDPNSAVNITLVNGNVKRFIKSNNEWKEETQSDTKQTTPVVNSSNPGGSQSTGNQDQNKSKELIENIKKEAEALKDKCSDNKYSVMRTKLDEFIKLIDELIAGNIDTTRPILTYSEITDEFDKLSASDKQKIQTQFDFLVKAYEAAIE